MNLNTKMLVAALMAVTMTSCSKEELADPAAPVAPLREKSGSMLRYGMELSTDHGMSPASGLDRDMAIVLRWRITDPADPVVEAYAKIYRKGLEKDIANKVVMMLETDPVVATGNEQLEFKRRLNISGTKLAQGFLNDGYLLLPERAWTLSGQPVELYVDIEEYMVQ